MAYVLEGDAIARCDGDKAVVKAAEDQMTPQYAAEDQRTPQYAAEEDQRHLIKLWETRRERLQQQ